PRSRGRRRRRGPGHRRRRGPGHRRGRRTVGLRRGGGRRFGGSGPGVGGGGAGALGPARVPQVLSAGRVLRRLLGPLRGARGRVGALGQSRRRAAALPHGAVVALGRLPHAVGGVGGRRGGGEGGGGLGVGVR